MARWRCGGVVGGGAPGCLIKGPPLSKPFCVGSLILLSVNCHSKNLLPYTSPSLSLSLFVLTAGGVCDCRRKRWPGSLRLSTRAPPHLITWSEPRLMASALSAGWPKRPKGRLVFACYWGRRDRNKRRRVSSCSFHVAQRTFWSFGGLSVC